MQPKTNVGSELMMPWGIDIDLVEGTMREPDRVLVGKPSDMRGHCRDAAALARMKKGVVMAVDNLLTELKRTRTGA